MGQPWPLLSFIFGLFKQTSLQFYNKYMWKKIPSSIRCWDLNPWPLEHESLPVTTRPRPFIIFLFFEWHKLPHKTCILMSFKMDKIDPWYWDYFFTVITATLEAIFVSQTRCWSEKSHNFIFSHIKQDGVCQKM